MGKVYLEPIRQRQWLIMLSSVDGIILLRMITQIWETLEKDNASYFIINSSLSTGVYNILND